MPRPKAGNTLQIHTYTCMCIVNFYVCMCILACSSIYLPIFLKSEINGEMNFTLQMRPISSIPSNPNFKPNDLSPL